MRKVSGVLLLSLLIVAFALPASAADVKFSGSYVAQGYYDNNRALLKDGGASVSNVWQRLRVQTDFQIQEGLMFTTRFDALEKVWGAARSTTATSTNLAGNDDESENIKFTWAFVTFNIPGGNYGTLKVGYQEQGTWGTAFGDTGQQDYGNRVKWDLTTGPWFWGARWDKVEGSKYYSPSGPAGNVGVATYEVDHDYEKYSVLGGYKWSKGDAGLQITYYRNTTTADNPATGYKSDYTLFYPYVRAQLGIVYIESEVGFLTGKDKDYNTAGVNRDIKGWRGYIMASADLAPAYIGALAFYSSGDDIGTTDKNEGGAKIGTDFQPCLILWNYDLGRWNGALGGQNGMAGTNVGGYNSDNVMAGQIFAGIKPVPKLDIKASYTTAQMDKDAVVGQVSKNIGSEFDISATYKIYDNLSYMVGFGYLWAGDAFKGSNAGAAIDNDYLITHKLTLSF
ncbi:MAG TPA: hypothetical protein VLZ07_01355 [Syntrophales bacterium]|nr:hypothetical protein [Syntrophales bacterium]